MLALAIISFLVISRSHSSAETTGDDRTTYVCSKERCITKISLETFKHDPNLTTFQSMENCRLLCGKNGNLWPLPTSPPSLGKKLIAIDPRKMALTAEGNPDMKSYLEKVFDIFRQNLEEECGGLPITSSETPVNFQFKVQDPEIRLVTNTSEEYDLGISYKPGALSVAILSKTVFGARHALETISQLTSRVMEPKTCSVFMIDSAVIRDKPVFRHRGILIDTARHFIPMEDLKRTVRAMAANKLNVLHWHASDSHSFPLHLSKVPSLARLGAYSEKETYSEQDITELVDYAKLRGVRILMEIDSPAHASNGWQFGEEQGLGKLVLCRNYVPWQHGCLQPPCGQLNPANPNVYQVLGDVYKNLQNLLPTEDMFHMGGDEVYFPCWAMSDEIKNYMKDKGYPVSHEGYMKLWAEFHKRALDAWDKAAGHSKTKAVVWTSDLTDPSIIANYLDKDRYIIEAWTGKYNPVPMNLIEMGYELIYASVDAWYFDHGFDGGHYHSWNDVYDNIIPKNPKVLGGEASLWTELVDSNNLDTKLWPRGAALAERLWTSPLTPSDNATYRLLETRERLIRRGVQVDQIIPQWCYLNQGLC